LADLRFYEDVIRYSMQVTGKCFKIRPILLLLKYILIRYRSELLAILNRF